MSTTISGRGGVLFTAFEPSGDRLAAPVIARLIKEHPELPVFAWGGPAMEAAGATIVEKTSGDGAMGLNSISHARSVRKQIIQINRWMKQYRIVAHVPVDSPAANFHVCRGARKVGARVIHLAAPQLWAWGRWRVGKLRKLTDCVLCLLPFEEEWFRKRDIVARFIGHPAINRNLDSDALKNRMHGLPHGAPRVAIFPGSRSHEVRRNVVIMARVFEELKSRHSALAGLIVAHNNDMATVIRSKVKAFPSGLHMIVGGAEAAIAWCDVALAVSGTITLDITRQRKPMVGMYKTGLLSWIGAKALIRSKYCLLPNIIAEEEIVPEYVPYIGRGGAIQKSLIRIFDDSRHAAAQTHDLSEVLSRFSNKRPAQEAAELIMEIIEHGSPRRGGTNHGSLTGT
jgi:lipid-A-disaccharide synthase